MFCLEYIMIILALCTGKNITVDQSYTNNDCFFIRMVVIRIGRLMVVNITLIELLL